MKSHSSHNYITPPSLTGRGTYREGFSYRTYIGHNPKGPDAASDSSCQQASVPHSTLGFGCYPRPNVDFHQSGHFYQNCPPYQGIQELLLQGGDMFIETGGGGGGGGGQKKSLTPTSSDERKRTKKKFVTEGHVLKQCSFFNEDGPRVNTRMQPICPLNIETGDQKHYLHDQNQEPPQFKIGQGCVLDELLQNPLHSNNTNLTNEHSPLRIFRHVPGVKNASKVRKKFKAVAK